MIDYTEPKCDFPFHTEEAELMLYAATGGDVTKLPMESQEEFDILITCFSEWVQEIT